MRMNLETLDEVLRICHVPVPTDIHPLAADAVARWLAGVWDGHQMLYINALVNSDYIPWTECLIALQGSVGT